MSSLGRLADLGQAAAGRSGWTVSDELSHRERKAGIKPAGVVVRRPAADVRAASVVALERGGAFVPHPFRQDAPQFISESLRGWCERPLVLRQEGEGHFQLARRAAAAEWQPGRTLEQFVQCRKCAGCRRWKRAMWSGRAGVEFLQSWRTWLGTLTFAPHERYRVQLQVRARLSAAGVDFDRLSRSDQFKELSAELWPHLRNMIKRLRRVHAGMPGLDIRYFVACEPHPSSGFPHFHILLHEQRHHPGVGRRQLEAQWRDAQSGAVLGFAKFKLVRDVGGARYAAKYLGKYDVDRVKASQQYGRRDDVPLLVSRDTTGIPMPVAAYAEDADQEHEAQPSAPAVEAQQAGCSEECELSSPASGEECVSVASDDALSIAKRVSGLMSEYEVAHDPPFPLPSPSRGSG